MEPATTSVDEAKQFLVTCLTEQAHKDKVSLSEREKQLFLFSESNPLPSQNRDSFDDMDSDAFEQKTSKLLRRAYAVAKKSPVHSQQWRDALVALQDEDFYGLVAVDLAEIPRPTPRMPLLGAKVSVTGIATFAAPFLAQAVLLALGALVVLDP